MASGTIPTAAPSLSRSPSSSSSSSLAPQPCSDRFTRLSFPLALQTKPLASIKGGRGACNGDAFVRKAQLNEIVGEASNDAAVVIVKDEDIGKEAPLPPVELSPQAISEFMNQVSSLVKLVDSKDVVELQLKQPGCELIIRKKEALPQLPAPQVVMVPSHAPPPVATPSYSAPPPPAAPSQPAAALPAPATAPQSPKSSHPPLKSPMAGTFYRSPAPGQPAFVKPGDKVKKGQVLCIIEAMKLMNEIEADHAGTVVEILAEDGKPVGVDQPLFVIEA